jgi:predicted DNA-binding protein (UPF0251 family)
MPRSSRTISRSKGVDLCTDFLFSGKKTGDIVRECMEKYGVSRSAVEKWLQLARPKVEILQKEADAIKRQEVEKISVESAQRLGITRDAVLARLWAISNGNIQDCFTGKSNMVPVSELPREVAALLSSVEVDEIYVGSGKTREAIGQTKKVKMLDPLRAIDMINKMQGWYKEEDKGPLVNLTVGYGKEEPV